MIRKSTDTRQEEIKKAFLNIIYRDGLKKLSTRNLAREVGISEGAIFRHFASKNDIILAIINDVQQDMIEELRIITLESGSPAKRLFKYLCKTITYLIENNGITMLLFSEAAYGNDKELIAKLNYIFNSQKQLAGKIISDGIAEGIWDESVSVEDFTTLYMGIPITLNIELILNKENFHKDNFCIRMHELLMRILKR
jgi:AcrR family transcriptional regulator